MHTSLSCRMAAVMVSLVLAACHSIDPNQPIMIGEASGAQSWQEVEQRPAPTTPSRPTDDARSSGGRVVEFSGAITSFRPDEASSHLDAAAVDLRSVFADLGDVATEWYQHVQTLADPFFEGRVPGSNGAELTRDYIAFYFEKYGLRPAFDGTYRQPFEFSSATVPPSVEHARMLLGETPLVDGEAYTVLGNSGSGVANGPLTFVGYGIARGPEGYSSFDDDTDLSGRVALLLRYVPLDEEGQRLWSPRQNRQQAAIVRKMAAVRNRGAAAIMLVNPPDAPTERPPLEPLSRSAGFGSPLDVPVVQVTTEQAQRLVAAAAPGGHDLIAMRKMADTGAIGCVDFNDDITVTIETEIDRKGIAAVNIGGVLPGLGDLADEWVVIGGHHDHVGTGRLGGINRRNLGQLHPGADDNASGTAGVVVLARKLAEAFDDAPDDLDRRSILFVTFDAEEMGLHGSRHLTRNLPMEAESISLMINMDMIGRLRGGNLGILGVGTAEGLRDLIEMHVGSTNLTAALENGGSGRSDEANFHRASVAGIHLFTGMHDEYTSPQDVASTVNPGGAAEVLGLAFDIAYDVATRQKKLAYNAPEATQRPGQGRAPQIPTVSLGIRPADEVLERGVLIGVVVEGSAAAEAGLEDGDVIIGWDDQKIDGLGELFETLMVHEPGDEVVLTVLRDGAEVEVGVKLRPRG